MFKFYVVHTCLLKNKIYTQRQATTNVVGSVFMDKCSDPKTIHAKGHNNRHEEGLRCNVNLHVNLESNGEGNSIVLSGFSESYGKLLS